MLACAHVLAMDAKNLLDVVDSIRVRYPDLVLPAHLQPQQPPSPTVQHFQQNLQPAASNNCANPSTAPQVIHSHTVTQTMTYQTQVLPQDNENQYQNSPNDCYQNATAIARQQLQHSSPPTSLTHSYTTGPPLPPNNESQSQIPPQQIYSNQQGIYDTDGQVSSNSPPAPVKKPEGNSSHPVKVKPTPPVRAPTTGLVSKMRANFQPSSDPTASKGYKSTPNNDTSLNEPLKIIEDPNEMYSNTAGIQLPEPVSCQIVQENLMPNQQQKVMGTNLGK